MGTTADKLAKLLSTRRAMKDAINGSGSTVGDVFADYPPAVTNGRAGIASATTEKGVQTPADAPFDVLEANVRAIKQDTPVSAILEFESDSTVGIDSILESYPNAYVKTDNNFRKRVSIKKGTPDTFGYDEGQVVYHLWAKISDGGEEKYMLMETARITDYAVSGKIYNIVG